MERKFHFIKKRFIPSQAALPHRKSAKTPVKAAKSPLRRNEVMSASYAKKCLIVRRDAENRSPQPSPQGAVSYTQHLRFCKSGVYPLPFKLHGCWLPLLTPVTWFTKLLGLRSVAAYMQLEATKYSCPYLNM
jgi:hypothetical protein